MLYGTTTEFLRAFGLTSIHDLPEPDGLTEIEKLLMEREDDGEETQPE
jgi:chromosome segregation and condensation protein ScpB